MFQRMIVSFVMALGLSGCWLSQEPLFTPTDYAEVDLNGRVYNTMDDARPVGVVHEVVSIEPDRRVKLMRTAGKKVDENGDEIRVREETLYVAFIEIPNTPDGWHLLLNFEKDGTLERPYLIANIAENRTVKIYTPHCAGTKPYDNVERIMDIRIEMCDFKTREALTSAAQDVVTFLTKPQPVQILPVVDYRFLPDY